MTSLVEIWKDNNTDKVLNGFAELYDKLFGPIREDVRSILEIGIDQGWSIKGWREFFPNATIFAVDIREEAVSTVRNDWHTIALVGDVTDREFMRDTFCRSRYDIVIDDGSHYNTDVFNAFEQLWPRVKSGGYYFVEDIQCPEWDRDHPRIIEWFAEFADKESLVAEFRWNILYLRKP